MLSKLIGYEFKSTRRIFLPAFGVLLLLSLANSIFIALPEPTLDHVSAPFGVLMTVYVLAMFAVYVLAFAYMINRFYKNLLGDEGYLMFTLPARPSQLIWAKCITSTIWMVVTVILCCISLFLLATPALLSASFEPEIAFSDFWHLIQYIFSELMREYGANLFLVPLELIAIGIAGIINFCMHIYACLSLGSLANKHRLGFAFLAYLGFGVAKEILLFISSWIFDLTGLNLDFNLTLNTAAQMHIALLGWLLFTIVCIAVNFVITNYILSRHLNLQ